MADRQKLKTILHDVEAEPCALPLQLLKDITNNFSVNLKIGSGGFGVVYKGVLDGQTVAVKKITIHEGNFHTVSREFENEVKSLVAVKHQNIVRFLGYCSETHEELINYNGNFVKADKQEKLLCLQYMPKGSLKNQITDESHGLEWHQRYKMIKGICHGIHYLHTLKVPIAHLDLKPDNILLTNEMEPRITDFGLSRLFNDQSRIISERAVFGTRGYMAPECRSDNMLSKAADIFSLGIIVLEIITGYNYYEEIVENSMQGNFVMRVLEKWMKRTSSLEIDQIKICTEIGLQCVQVDRKSRPMSKDIIMTLDKGRKLQVNNRGKSPPHNYNPVSQLDQLKLNNNAGSSRQNSSGSSICAGCKNPIGQSVLLAMDSKWHHKCFKCFACNRPISESQFSIRDNHPYHKACHKEHCHPKCVDCGNFIPADRDGTIRYGIHPSGGKHCLTHR